MPDQDLQFTYKWAIKINAHKQTSRGIQDRGGSQRKVWSQETYKERRHNLSLGGRVTGGGHSHSCVVSTGLDKKSTLSNTLNYMHKYTKGLQYPELMSLQQMMSAVQLFGIKCSLKPEERCKDPMMEPRGAVGCQQYPLVPVAGSPLLLRKPHPALSHDDQYKPLGFLFLAVQHTVL